MTNAFSKIRLTNSEVITSGGRLYVGSTGMLLQSETGGFTLNNNTGQFITSDQTGSFLSTAPQNLVPSQRIQFAKNSYLTDNRYSQTQTIAAEEDTYNYVSRLSVTSLASTDTTNVTVLDTRTVRDSINAIYNYVGKPALVDAWFLSTNHNVLTGVTVPAFLSSGNNGTMISDSSPLPSTGADGLTFVNAHNSAIKLPTGLNAYLGSFTDIVIAQPNSLNYTGAGRCLIGNFSLNPSGAWGYNIIIRDSATPNQQAFGFQSTGPTGENFFNIIAKPAGMSWQCVAVSHTSGAQAMYLNGRLVATGTNTNTISTSSRSIGIGGAWITANTQAWDTFNGKIIFACKLSGIYSEEIMCRLTSALQSMISPLNGTVNFISAGDSRSGGTEIVSGRLTPTITSSTDEHYYWQERLMTGSNWSGKASTIKAGISSFTAYSMVNSAYYEQAIRKFRPGWKNAEMTVWAGVNDMGTAGRSANEVYSLLTGFCSRAKGDGFKITMLGQLTDYTTGSALALKSVALDTLLSGTPIGKYWDRYISLYDHFPVGPYYDGLHLTDSGNARLADILNSGIIPDTLH